CSSRWASRSRTWQWRRRCMGRHRRRGSGGCWSGEQLLEGTTYMRQISRGLLLALSFAIVATVGCSSRCQVPSNLRAVLLPGGKAALRVPPEYQTSTEVDETLVLIPSNGAAITLRLNAHLPKEPGVASDVGVRFVRDQAKEKGLTVTEKKGKVYLTE